MKSGFLVMGHLLLWSVILTPTDTWVQLFMSSALSAVQAILTDSSLANSCKSAAFSSRQSVASVFKAIYPHHDLLPSFQIQLSSQHMYPVHAFPLTWLMLKHASFYGQIHSNFFLKRDKPSMVELESLHKFPCTEPVAHIVMMYWHQNRDSFTMEHESTWQ